MSIDFGKKLKELRIKAGFLQIDIAEELSISNKTISTWETGKKEPSIDTILLLCDILQTTPNELLGYTSKKIEC